ncbi:hypothetical protein HK104_002562 [Borealophlyctis nickersoniae]|nr:hypothetical protein HK104_002562 [Borealophlyctis nickersoniae]
MLSALLPSLFNTKTTVLPLPPRLQWTDHYGYCGETSLQTALLPHGIYISQYLIRSVVAGTTDMDRQTVQESQLLLGANNTEAVLDKLGIVYEYWKAVDRDPNYKQFLGWCKNMVMEKNGWSVSSRCHYDHLLLITGFSSRLDTSTYNGNDTVTYNSNLEPYPITTPLYKFHDTRNQTDRKSNTSKATNWVPNDAGCCWGLAIMGVKWTWGAGSLTVGPGMLTLDGHTPVMDTLQ